uniref:M-phase-specific PLK1-interacting protein n=2 Tax=Timema TaxID=61471 RepID=A0A7R9IS36_9NEOP|nr:unnamed protein product [Timema bartmani]CAD7463421.1 unnamed protein product [Timema tahoe]
MDQNGQYNSPLGASGYNGGNLSTTYPFARPRGQFSPRHGNSPYGGSPRGRFDGSDFIPLGFSSPLSTKHGGNTSNHWRGRNRFSNSPGSFNSSNRSDSPYNSSNRGNRFSQNRRGGGFSNPGHTQDISQYCHPSMLEDPWSQLDSKVKTCPSETGRPSSSKEADTTTMKDSSFVLSDNDDGRFDSQETDITELSSSEGSS